MVKNEKEEGRTAVAPQRRDNSGLKGLHDGLNVGNAALAGEPAHQQRAEAASLRPDPPALCRAECGRRSPQGSPAGR